MESDRVETNLRFNLNIDSVNLPCLVLYTSNLDLQVIQDSNLYRKYK